MTVFVDTSALYALLDADDAHHVDARAAWQRLAAAEATLVTHSYVLVETIALVQHRLGLAAVRALVDTLGPLLTVVWVTAPLHEEALAATLAANARHLTLVDQVSFLVARRRNCDAVWAFDDDFERAGFVRF